ncbi:MAG: YihY/virulence factor BrkB family protein [Acidimicrobiales bacterium]
MSSATPVPETHSLQTEGPWTTLHNHGNWALVKESFIRMRYADGFSHSRALAFQITLAFIPFLVATEGFAGLFHKYSFAQVIEQTLRLLTPGATQSVLKTAGAQAAQASNNGAVFALVFGLLASLVSIATALGQIERGANRIYGVEQDRAGPKKYGLATLLGIGASTMLVAALALLVAGSAVGASLKRQPGWGHAVADAWWVGRYPIGVAMAVAVFAVLFRISPRRQQPSTSWLMLGSGVSVVLWLITTGGLALYVDNSGDFGKIYGPLTGVMALLLWSLLSSISLFLGLAFAAQLESFRAGVLEPVDEDKASGQVEADEDGDAHEQYGAGNGENGGMTAPAAPTAARP